MIAPVRDNSNVPVIYSMIAEDPEAEVTLPELSLVLTAPVSNDGRHQSVSEEHTQ